MPVPAGLSMITVVSLTLLFAAFAAAAQHEDVTLADLIEELERREKPRMVVRAVFRGTGKGLTPLVRMGL